MPRINGLSKPPIRNSQQIDPSWAARLVALGPAVQRLAVEGGTSEALELDVLGAMAAWAFPDEPDPELRATNTLSVIDALRDMYVWVSHWALLSHDACTSPTHTWDAVGRDMVEMRKKAGDQNGGFEWWVAYHDLLVLPWAAQHGRGTYIRSKGLVSAAPASQLPPSSKPGPAEPSLPTAPLAPGLPPSSAAAALKSPVAQPGQASATRKTQAQPPQAGETPHAAATPRPAASTNSSVASTPPDRPVQQFTESSFAASRLSLGTPPTSSSSRRDGVSAQDAHAIDSSTSSDADDEGASSGSPTPAPSGSEADSDAPLKRKIVGGTSALHGEPALKRPCQQDDRCKAKAVEEEQAQVNYNWHDVPKRLEDLLLHTRRESNDAQAGVDARYAEAVSLMLSRHQEQLAHCAETHRLRSRGLRSSSLEGLLEEEEEHGKRMDALVARQAQVEANLKQAYGAWKTASIEARFELDALTINAYNAEAVAFGLQQYHGWRSTGHETSSDAAPKQPCQQDDPDEARAAEEEQARVSYKSYAAAGTEDLEDILLRMRMRYSDAKATTDSRCARVLSEMHSAHKEQRAQCAETGCFYSRGFERSSRESMHSLHEVQVKEMDSLIARQAQQVANLKSAYRALARAALAAHKHCEALAISAYNAEAVALGRQQYRA